MLRFDGHYYEHSTYHPSQNGGTCKVTWKINGTNDIYPLTSISSQLSVSECLGWGRKEGQAGELKFISLLGGCISGWSICMDC